MRIREVLWWIFVAPIIILGFFILITPFLVILTLLDKRDEKRMVDTYKYIEKVI